MNKIAVLGDTHFGVRNDSVVFMDYSEKFYSEIFFPYLIKHNIKEIIQTGDFFDRRKYINFLTLQRTYQMFIDRLAELNIKLHMFLGNHDVFYKNTNELNSPGLLLSHIPEVDVYAYPTELFGKIAMVPWITEDNFVSCHGFMSQTKMKICIGHFDIVGFSMYKGMPSIEGLNAADFKKFDLVISGHYHHKSQQGNIVYVGTPFQHTWQDYDDPRGFHILNLDDNSLEFIQNPFEIFHHVRYDDKINSMAEINSMDLSKYTDTYVKVIIVNKTNPPLFERFMSNLDKVNPADVTIVEDFTNLDDDSIAEDALDQAEDTLTIINKYIDTSPNGSVDPSKLKTVIRDLYNRALNQQDI